MPRTRLKIHVKYFPFAHGVPFKIKGSKYIVPKMDADNWNKVFNNRKAIITCHGGFIENLSATMISEAISYIRREQQIEWMVDPTYKHIWNTNGIGKQSSYVFGKDVLDKYPVPAFFNNQQTSVYVKCLNNYLDMCTICGDKRYRRKDPIISQIFSNSMVGWSSAYLPKMRNLTIPNSLVLSTKMSRFNLDLPFILLIPDETNLSIHNIAGLNWTINDIKSFAAMIRDIRYNLIILTNKPQRYYGLNALVHSSNIESLLYLITKANVILSKDIDFTNAALLISKAKVFSTMNKNEFNLNKAKKYLKVENSIFTAKILTPYRVFQELQCQK